MRPWLSNSASRVLITPNGSVYSLVVPLLADFQHTHNPILDASTSHEINPDSSSSPVLDAKQIEREWSFIRKAKESGVVYLLRHGDIRARKDSWFLKELVINYFYAFLRRNCRRGITTLILKSDSGWHDLHGLTVSGSQLT